MLRTILVLCLLTPALALADGPNLVVPTTGRLLDAQDAPVDGTHHLSFSLWSNLAHVPGETALWTDDYDVDVQHGLYEASLGDPDHKLLPALVFTTSAPVYLEIGIDGVTLAPRLRVGTVPVAGTALTALALDCAGCVAKTALAFDPDIVADGAVGTPQLQDGAVTTSKIADGAVTDALIADGLDGAKLAAGSVASDALANGLDGAKLAAGSVSSDALASGLDGAKLAAGSVSNDALANGLDGAKLAAGSVSSDALANGLDGAKLAAGSVSNDALASGLDGAKLAVGSVSADALASGIPAGKVAGLTSIQTQCPVGQVLTGYDTSFNPQCGAGAPALVQWQAASVDFGSSTTADVSKSATLVNAGGTAVKGALTITAPDGFTHAESCDANLAPGATCEVTFTLQASGTTGARTGVAHAFSANGSAALLLTGSYDPRCETGNASTAAGASCAEALANSPTCANQDGLYFIGPTGAPPFQVFCDMSTDGGGWTYAMGVDPSDGHLVDWPNTSFWVSQTETGSLANRFTNDFKSQAAWLIGAKSVLVEVANRGPSGSIIGWKEWTLSTPKSFNQFFSDPMNTVQTYASPREDTAGVYPWEPLLRNGTQLVSNRQDNPNGDDTRLGVTNRPYSPDDNAPGLGTGMNEGSYPNAYRLADVELQWNTNTNIWCTAPTGAGTYTLIGNDVYWGSSTGSCQNEEPVLSPGWSYRIFVK